MDMLRKGLWLIMMLAVVPMLYAAELPVGAAAPAFSLKNVDGKMVSLADYAGSKGYVVIFSCNSCPFAKAYQDRIIQLYKDYHPKGIAMVVISSNDPKIRPEDSYDNLQKRAAEKSYPFPYLYDEAQTAARAYGATNTPHAFIFDKDMKLVYRGRIDDNVYEDKVKTHEAADVLNDLLSGKADKITTSVTKPFGCTIKWHES
jgi:peroxiredoxin